MAFTLKIPARVKTATFPELLSTTATLKSRTVFHNTTKRNSNRILVEILEHATARLRPVMEPDHTIALADALVRAGVEWKGADLEHARSSGRV